MSDLNRVALMEYRIEQAREYLADAERSLLSASYRTSVNRSYYCIFQAMRAVLALDGFDSKKHSGIIAEFRRRYIRTGVFGSTMSDIIGNAFEVRNSSDYEDFYIVSSTEAKTQLSDAKLFFDTVESYISANGKS